MEKKDSSGRGKKEYGNATQRVDIMLRKVFRSFLEKERKENPQFFSLLGDMKDSEILASLRRNEAKREEAMAMEVVCSSNNAVGHNSQDEWRRSSKEKSKNRKNLKF